MLSKSEWIAIYGSDDLKNTIARGYPCDRAYLEERLKLENPGWHYSYIEFKEGDRIDAIVPEEVLQKADETEGAIVVGTRENIFEKEYILQAPLPDWAEMHKSGSIASNFSASKVRFLSARSAAIVAAILSVSLLFWANQL